MHVSITGRHMEITPAIREFVQSRLDRLDRFAEPVDVQVTLSVEKYRNRAEIQLRDGFGSFFAAEESNDLFASIDLAIDRLESQTKRQHDKVIESRHGRRAQEAKKEFLSSEPQEPTNEQKYFGPY